MFPNLQSLFWSRQNLLAMESIHQFAGWKMSASLCHIPATWTLTCSVLPITTRVNNTVCYSCPLISASPAILRLCGRVICTLQLYLCLLKTMQFEWQNGPLGIFLRPITTMWENIRQHNLGSVWNSGCHNKIIECTMILNPVSMTLRKEICYTPSCLNSTIHLNDTACEALTSLIC